jgi:hypothetical protein
MSDEGIIIRGTRDEIRFRDRFEDWRSLGRPIRISSTGAIVDPDNSDDDISGPIGGDDDGDFTSTLSARKMARRASTMRYRIS